MKTIPILTALPLVLAAGLAPAQDVAVEPEAVAVASMKDGDGKDLGQVTFRQTASGILHVIVEMQGLPPGPHGFHIHETGKCEGNFDSAGGHYAGGGAQHGVDSPDGPHAGDFPNVHVGQDGILKAEFFTERLSMAEGAEAPLIDQDGSAVMLHEGADDHASNPAGDAGGRLACGVVEQPA